MSVNRILLLAAVVLFAITALSAFSDSINVNETGFLALGLTCYAASHLDLGVGRVAGPRRRVLR
ncbi:MAG: hypothetical protein LC792_26140 [Actinobacteria bacterium]|nr:hypothetical protein [Actinomycetota bacterium]